MTSEPPLEQKPHGLAGRRFTIDSNGRKVEVVVPGDDDGYVLKEIFEERCYKPVPGVPSPRSVLDIGANIGLAAAFFRLTYPEALIHCVEPDPVAWSYLAHNTAQLGNCRLHHVGLYEGDCERPFYSATNTVMSSLARNPLASATPNVLKLRDAGRFVSELGVERFDLIKIDTEGAEVPIIRSLGTIVMSAAMVHLEFHSRADRRAIDDLMNPSHCLYYGVIEAAHRGHFTYVANDLCPRDVRTAPLSLEG
ncbi:MAG TPA: FkbM family methyltransferase [Stellaceae bacterium]|nr:FkbM family methyltransferase [Stellaceae bacterium]